jgi:hypothetical protein
MRAGFELYRAFDRDAEDNRAALERNGKLTVPVLAVGGEISTSGTLVAEMMRDADCVAFASPAPPTGSLRRCRRRSCGRCSTSWGEAAGPGPMVFGP